MPIGQFWLLEDNIARIQANNDMRALRVAGAAQSQEGSTGLMADLNKEMGVVVKIPEKLDREGLGRLKAIQQAHMRGNRG